MILTVLSFNIADAVAGGIVTTKSVAFRLPSRFRFTVLGVPDVPFWLVVVVVVVPLVVPVLLILFCNATVAVVGGLMAYCRILLRLTWMTATSPITSGRGLSGWLTHFAVA